MSASSIKRKSTLHNLFTKEKGSLFNVKIWMKLLVKKNTQCYGNENRNQNKKEIDYGILTVNIYDFLLAPQILEK